MLGNPGSNPLELFWDVVDMFDQQLDTMINLCSITMTMSKMGIIGWMKLK
jgi:pre-mRNA-processing factor 40